ncbi:MAG TPA: M1 family aminopeptidase [Candidatus Krumholzibacteriaceae bacterium]|nr:M1 family aminopeptidase [Candidatus Krumholzibacteriaceae bacterium]
MHKIKSIVTALVLIILSGDLSAQEITRPQLHREMARAKAERFSGIKRAVYGQTQNQSDYDVVYYDIDIEIDPAAQTVSGTVTLTAKVISVSLYKVEIDLLDNMNVTRVRKALGDLDYTHSNDLITVTLDRSYHSGEYFTVEIEYSGTPSEATGAFNFDKRGGEDMIWSLSEPFGARSWWPCKDVPNDKADSVDIRVTVPSNLIVASNGTLEGITDEGSTDTYSWHEKYPIATYLVSVAIHPYTTFSHWYHHSPGDSMEVQYYVFPDHYSYIQDSYSQTVPAIELFSELFGEYPFIDEKYGHAEFMWGGGMEHQTITSLGGVSVYLIVHELAHQWWGDMITCDDFHHIWMNEGFAVYSEALWAEDKYGKEGYDNEMLITEYFGEGTIYVPEADDWNRIFDVDLTYHKASWVLHMLRHVVGDSVFFDILRGYYSDARYQYGTVTTEQFRDICEDISGMQLDDFFHQWIYEEYYPNYIYQWTSTEKSGYWDIDLTIEQTQTNHIFNMPIDVAIETAYGDTTLIVVRDSLAVQKFSLSVDDEPVCLTLDPENWILCDIDHSTSSEFQLLQNYPNSFNEKTRIPFNIAVENSFVTLRVYDVGGKLISTLASRRYSRGPHWVTWDGKNDRGQAVSSGVYFYRITAGSNTEAGKMLFIK